MWPLGPGADPLKQDNIELLSGPYELSSHVDLTGKPSAIYCLFNPHLGKIVIWPRWPVR